MKTQNGRIIIERVVRFSPTYDGVSFTDESETNLYMSIKDLIRLYEGTKFSLEGRGVNWEKFCNELFNLEKQL